MKVLSATFVRGAVRREDFPRDPLPQLALVGRSNVGKSTLINALTRQRVARTSAAPGKTREINLYLVTLEGLTPGRLYLADLPGYGYARGGEATAREFDRLTQEYFSCPAATRKTAADRWDHYGPSAAILVVDARHPGLDADSMAHLWLNSTTLPVTVIAAKVDKLNRTERARALHAWEKHLNAAVIPVAAINGDGLAEVWKAIARMMVPAPMLSPPPLTGTPQPLHQPRPAEMPASTPRPGPHPRPETRRDDRRTDKPAATGAGPKAGAPRDVRKPVARHGQRRKATTGGPRAR